MPCLTLKVLKGFVLPNYQQPVPDIEITKPFIEERYHKLFL